MSTTKAEIGLRQLLQKGRVIVRCRVGFKAGQLSTPHQALVTGIDEDGTVHIQDSWGYVGRTGIDADGGMFKLTWDKFDACWQSIPDPPRGWAQILPRELMPMEASSLTEVSDGEGADAEC